MDAMTIKEAVERLKAGKVKISSRTLRNAIAAGVLKVVRSDPYMVTQEAIDEYFAWKATQPGSGNRTEKRGHRSKKTEGEGESK